MKVHHHDVHWRWAYARGETCTKRAQCIKFTVDTELDFWRNDEPICRECNVDLSALGIILPYARHRGYTCRFGMQIKSVGRLVVFSSFGKWKTENEKRGALDYVSQCLKWNDGILMLRKVVIFFRKNKHARKGVCITASTSTSKFSSVFFFFSFSPIEPFHPTMCQYCCL